MIRTFMYMDKLGSIRLAEPHESFIVFYLGMVTDKPLQFILAALLHNAHSAGQILLVLIGMFSWL